MNDKDFGLKLLFQKTVDLRVAQEYTKVETAAYIIFALNKKGIKPEMTKVGTTLILNLQTPHYCHQLDSFRYPVLFLRKQKLGHYHKENILT